MIAGLHILLTLLLFSQAPEKRPLDKSQYFAFVDREYIFTIELVKPGVPLLNFVSMSPRESKLVAKNIKLSLENRKSTVKLLAVETGDFNRPMSVTSMTIKPRSSFGLRVEGDFGKATELHGATIQIGDENFALEPLNSFDFENLVLKVNRLNLGSPDFSDDWRILKLDFLGSRSPARN